MVSRSDRGFKVGIAFEFEHHVLSFLTLDLLIQASLLNLLHNLSFNSLQLYWSEDRLTLADRPDVYLKFPRFLDDVVEWVTDRRTRQSNRASNAMTLVRNSSEIFAGAGVYTISELWHMAGKCQCSRLVKAAFSFQISGLSPNLTEAEVFDSPSRTARLCGAFYHFAKEAHTTLW